MRKTALVLAAFAVSAASATTVVSAADQQTPTAVIDSAMDAYQARDRSRFVAHFAEDAVLDANGYSFEGRAQIARAYAENFSPDAPRVELVDREAYADRVIDTVQYHAQGQVICCSVTAYFVENGQITYARVTM